MKTKCIFVLSWLFVLESVFAEVTWTKPTNGQSESKAENTTVGTVIVTLAAKTATTYTIVSQTPDTRKFIILNENELQLNATLDFETETVYTLVLRADNGKGASADINYTVVVTDVNEAPVFNPTNASVTFESGTSGVIYNVSQHVTDPDDNDTITYSISGSDLSVDANGVVTPAKTLTYNPDSPSITVPVTANDSELTATFNLTVNIKTAPVITFTSNPMDFLESSTVGDTLYTYAFTDLDNDTDPKFSITKQSVAGTFEQKENTAIVVGSGQTFDFEGNTTQFNISLQAVDTSGLTGTATLTVNIVNENDENPVFSSSTDPVPVRETTATSTPVYNVSATDDGNSISYTITKGNTNTDFQIDSETGVVSVANALSFARTSTYNLEFTANDGAQQNTLTIDFNIKAPPVITFTSNPVDFSESSTGGDTLYTYAFTDPDNDTDPKFSITEQSVAGTFEQKENTAIVVASGQTFDFEGNTTKFTISLQAVDTSGLTGTATLTVNIVNENDEDPVFTSSTDPVPVRATTATNSDVYKVSATDDGDSISYTITSGSTDDDFQIDNNTGIVTVANTLSFARTSVYSIEFTADDGAQQNTLTVDFKIKTPTIWIKPETASSVSKAEDVNSAEVFYTISASDPDGDNLTYSIKTQTVSKFFTLGGASGRDVLLNTGNGLDYENTQSYTLTFEVTDGIYEPNESAELVITVTDVNDNAPTFSSTSINVAVKVTHSVGDTVKTLTATDADSSTDKNNVLTYRFHSGNEDGNFAISSSGEMTLEKNVTIGSTYTLVVEAVDGGTPSLTGRATLTVATAVATDPVLNELAAGTTLTVTVNEDAEVGKSVYGINASDSDGDQLTFNIKTQTPSEKFALVGNELQTTYALDFDTETSYTLVFEVDDDDGNTDNKLTSGTLTIMVTDLNDHYPIFPQEVYTVDIMERRTEVVNVIKLTATDADSNKSSNGMITYDIVGGDLNDLFTIDRFSGQLTTKNTGLRRSKQMYHVIAVQAKDGGSPARADSVHVIVNVTSFGSDRNGSLKQNLRAIVLAISLMLSFYFC